MRARNISGAWVPMGGGAAPIPSWVRLRRPPIVSKPRTPKAYEARRAADAEATQAGRTARDAGRALSAVRHAAHDVCCVVSDGDLQTPGQITIVTEAFSEVGGSISISRSCRSTRYLRATTDIRGRWDGDTLVIDTVGIKESVPTTTCFRTAIGCASPSGFAW